jgi:RimJ/RimL family protein N-acetyltransferase
VAAWAQRVAPLSDPFFYAVVDVATGHAVGRLALMRIDPAHGVIEVGHVLYAPSLQRSAHATEVQSLLARHVFEDLGYRRYEWKCNALNAPSRRAALRLGFRYEGVFRQHMVVKGVNRDSAWYSMLDSEWPARKAAFEAWLDPSNFTADGVQKTPLGGDRAERR